jgi:hypothetical protein
MRYGWVKKWMPEEKSRKGRILEREAVIGMKRLRRADDKGKEDGLVLVGRQGVGAGEGGVCGWGRGHA